MKILAVITARKSSKRLPCKNFRKVCGKSLTERSVEQAALARELGVVHDVVLSTDSEYLLEQCRTYGIVDIGLRPAHLAGDHTKSLDVLLDVLSQLQAKGMEYDAVMILQPTSPLRWVEDICGAVALFAASGNDSLITARPIPNATVNGLYCKQAQGFVPVSPEHNSGKRHQDLAPVYLRNGAIFISSVSLLNDKCIFGKCPAVLEMPQERSVDVDTAEDLAVVQHYLLRNSQSVSCGKETYATAEEAMHIANRLRQQGLQPIVPDVLRRWLCSQDLTSPQNFMNWCETHVYFDGLAVLIDGELVAGLEILSGISDCCEDPQLVQYLNREVAKLLCGADSVILEPAHPVNMEN